MRWFCKKYAIKLPILFFVMFFSLMGFSAIYYVDVAGNNSNDGSMNSPWKTLTHAFNTVTSPGDVIRINAGTFNETARLDLALGVSIEGAGMDATIIQTKYKATDSSDGAIRLHSGTSADGNQSISHLTLEGSNLTATRGICINFRNNVLVHHTKVTNFYASGIFFRGSKKAWDVEPSPYATGNGLNNCVVNNCATRSSGESASVRINGQTGFLLFNNSFTQTSRAREENGNILGGEWNKGLKIYDNVFTKPDNEGNAWNFFFELWHWQGGGEIYGNTFNGAATLDIVDVMKSNAEYGLKIYDNQFLVQSSVPFTGHNAYSITIEGRSHLEYMHIYDNYFKNVPNAIEYNMIVNSEEGYRTFDVRHIYIHHNVLENVGMTDLSNYPIWIEGYGANSNITVDHLYLYNNSIQSINNSNKALTGIQFHVAGKFSNIFVQNNIISNCRNSAITFDSNLAGATLSNVTVSNNLYYGNASDESKFNMKVSNKVEKDNIIGNPLFVSSTDYNLQANSPAIKKGKSMGLNAQSPNNGSAPDIGAYESSGSTVDAVAPVVTAFTVSPMALALRVPISIASATDNTKVTGCMLTETPTAPSPNAPGWTSMFPMTYVFSSPGSKTLYAWARDAAGNVSASRSDRVTVLLNKSAEIAGHINDSTQLAGSLSPSELESPLEMVKIDVFPNPCVDQVTVRFSQTPEPGSKIEIIDITGKKVAAREIVHESESFSMGQFPSGLYMVKTLIGSNEIINKLIVNE